jgi:hypothetical protein
VKTKIEIDALRFVVELHKPKEARPRIERILYATGRFRSGESSA